MKDANHMGWTANVHTHTDTHTYTLTHTHKRDRETDRQTDRQTDRHTDREGHLDVIQIISDQNLREMQKNKKLKKNVEMA